MARWAVLAGALGLALLYPVAWVAPLVTARVLPFFGGKTISVVSGLATLWRVDIPLALVVALFAIVAPMAKLAGIAAAASGRLGPWIEAPLALLGRLAMADVFLVALYVIVVKGAGLARVGVDWGLYLFTFCVLASLALARAAKAGPG